MKRTILGILLLGSISIVGCQKEEVAAPDAQLSADKLLHKDVLGEKDLAGSDTTTTTYYIETFRTSEPVVDTEKSKPAKKEKTEKPVKEKSK